MEVVHLRESLFLSNIKLSSSEESIFSSKFSSIVDLLDIIKNVKISSKLLVDERSETTKIDSLRGDIVLDSLKIEEIKRLSNSFLDGYFAVPKVLN